MKLTTKGRYAVMAMADLALFQNDKPVSLHDISLRQNISLSYLEQLFAKLKNCKLVKSVSWSKVNLRFRVFSANVLVITCLTLENMSS